MVIVEVATGQRITVAISPVEAKDFKQITKRRYSFDWKRERGIADIFKLSLAGEKDILGLVSIMDCPAELRIQIRLKYGMKDGGPQLFLDSAGLQALVYKYLS